MHCVLLCCLFAVLIMVRGERSPRLWQWLALRAMAKYYPTSRHESPINAETGFITDWINFVPEALAARGTAEEKKGGGLSVKIVN